MHPEVKRYYDEEFDQVNNCGVAGKATQQFHRRLESSFNTQDFFASILELGSAHGEHLKFIKHGFDAYVMLDLVKHRVDKSKLSKSIQSKAGKRRFRFETGNAELLPFQDSQFERILHTCLLHHLDNPEAALREMRRVVKDQGIISIYLPCDPGFLYHTVQSLTTNLKIVKALRKGNYTISAGYLRALEHPNHYLSLKALIEHTFSKDIITKKSFLFPFESYNFNFYTIYQVKIFK
jgi:ubiquinone/menaquinone biosynthesis C-methylase UbiE